MATSKQNPEESLQTFLNELRVLSKACNFQDVTAEVYRNELVRDAFINGLKSHEIRQRLLENNELTLDQAFDIANSFDMALEHSAAYLYHEKGMSAAAAVTPGDNIYDNGMQRGSSSSCTIPKSRKCSFCAKLIMNVTTALLETLFVIRVKREVIFHGPVDLDLGLSTKVSSRPSRHRQLRTCA